MYSVRLLLSRSLPYTLKGDSWLLATVTTIFVLVSAVQKLARVERIPEGLRLYRGLGGSTEMPLGFFRADENGCRGFVEWGLLHSYFIY
jgi:hypothetical protein